MIESADFSASVLLHDDCILAVNKPNGLATQAPQEYDSLERRVRDHLREKLAGNESFYLGLPHRLDRPVSGVILFALTPRAARKLSQQFERRTIDKRYWALVEGIVDPSEGTWRDFVRKVPDEPRAEIVEENSADAREAVLHYRTMKHTKLASWLEITLETGRNHQIRLQASSRGHAVLGDELYGSKIPFGPATDDPRQRAIALHACSIDFTHPTTSERVSLRAPVGENWEKND